MNRFANINSNSHVSYENFLNFVISRQRTSILNDLRYNTKKGYNNYEDINRNKYNVKNQSVNGEGYDGLGFQNSGLRISKKYKNPIYLAAASAANNINIDVGKNGHVAASAQGVLKPASVMRWLTSEATKLQKQEFEKIFRSISSHRRSVVRNSLGLPNGLIEFKKPSSGSYGGGGTSGGSNMTAWNATDIWSSQHSGNNAGQPIGGILDGTKLHEEALLLLPKNEKLLDEYKYKKNSKKYRRHNYKNNYKNNYKKGWQPRNNRKYIRSGEQYISSSSSSEDNSHGNRNSDDNRHNSDLSDYSSDDNSNDSFNRRRRNNSDDSNYSSDNSFPRSRGKRKKHNNYSDSSGSDYSYDD